MTATFRQTKGLCDDKYPRNHHLVPLEDRWAFSYGDIVSWEGGAGREFGRVRAYISELDVYQVHHIIVRDGDVVSDESRAGFRIHAQQLEDVAECQECGLLDGHHKSWCYGDHYEDIQE